MSEPQAYPSYLALAESGELARRAERLRQRLACCRLCPRGCSVNRLEGELGFCRTGAQARLSSAAPHFGEEPPLTGSGGSGTVFFAGCVLACVFCQNHQISQGLSGRPATDEHLAEAFLGLQAQGCENINLVSPTHVAAQCMGALALAAERGLRLPVVYNTGGYDLVDTLRFFEGVVDIYLPDAKYAADDVARRCLGVSDYAERNRAALREMFRQVGLLQAGKRGVARRGLIVRHLVMPNGLAGSRDVLRFIADELDRRVPISLMAQYSPQHLAFKDPDLNRPVTAREYQEALDAFDEAGLENGFIQGPPSVSKGLPDFDRDEPFEW